MFDDSVDPACAEPLVLERGHVVLDESDVALDPCRVDDVTSRLDVGDDHVRALLDVAAVPAERIRVGVE